MSGVYFIKHKGLSPVKIGYTSKDNCKDRINSMTTASPYGIVELGFISTANAQDLEEKLHKQFKSKRLNGEWFEISTEEVLEIIRNHDYDNKAELSKISNMLKELNISPPQVVAYLNTKLNEQNQFPLDLKESKFLNLARLAYKKSREFHYYSGNNEYVSKGGFIMELQTIMRKSRAQVYRYISKYDYYFDERKDGRQTYIKPLWSEEE